MGTKELKEMQDKLDRQEAKTHAGAPSMTPKTQMLDASDVQAAHPDHRVRWIQTGNAEKAQCRLADGYEVIPEKEGGRRVGGLALARTSRENYDARVATVKRKNQERLKSHKADVGRAVEAVVRELRDQHGISVDESRIMVDE